ncbi:unnamed protein product [Natator depressus]
MVSSSCALSLSPAGCSDQQNPESGPREGAPSPPEMQTNLQSHSDDLVLTSSEQGLQLPFYSLDIKVVQSGDTRERNTASLLQAQLFCFTISSVTLNLCISVPAVQIQGFSHLLSRYKNLVFLPLSCSPQHQKQEAGCQCRTHRR